MATIKTGSDMTKTQVPAAWIQQAALPPLCARHGSAATTHTKRTWYTSTPWWVVPICLFSLLIGLVVALAIRSSVTGPLPTCARCSRSRRDFRLVTAAIWVLTVVLLCAASAVRSGLLALFCLVTLVAGLFVWLLRDKVRVAGVLSRDKNWVELRGVDEEFARRIQAGLASAQAQPAPTHPAFGTHVGAGWGQPALPIPSSTLASPSILPGS